MTENLFIESKNITVDKDKEVSIFENNVKVVTDDNKVIESDYAEYNKKKGYLIFKNKVFASDDKNNRIQAEYAEYDEAKKIFRTKGTTKVFTSENYIIESEDITLDNKKFLIVSNKNSRISDQDKNIITLENFKYLTKKNIFKSIGYIEVEDTLKNNYEFSQIYIDTKKKEILGTDIKAFLNQKNFKINKDNKPRVFANTISLDKEKRSFNKSIFTLCDYRENDKCPPWIVQASKMLHDEKKKTIYYDNAIVKVYNIPIFYFPKLSHPDPTVDRRSGFLPASFSDTKNLGSGFSIPYFWAVDVDKNFTFTSKMYASENPLFLGEYHQAFSNSNLLADFGYTAGYKKTSSTKKPGEKSHFFSRFVKNFSLGNNLEGSLGVSVQDVSNDKYLKLYRIKSNLIDFNQDTLENSVDYTLESDEFFLGLNTSIYETLKEGYNDKYEYVFPEINFDKNLFSNDALGNLDLQSNFKIHNYDTNKTEKFLVNDFDWNYKTINHNNGIKSKLNAKIKNVNYEATNVDKLKEDHTNELFGAFGYTAQVELEKADNKLFKSFLTPKFLLRYAPGSMRKETLGSRINPLDIYSLDRLNNTNNFESGLSATLGFDYKILGKEREFNLSVGQIINEKENKNMPSITSLDNKLSDLVGSSSLKINDKLNFDYNFSIDQNYSDVNYSEVTSTLNLDSLKIDFNYLREMKHIGNDEYFKTKIAFLQNENKEFSLKAKRNLITNSSEYYDLSYEYINDCLRAGLVYRREFYNDSEIESENSFMFKVTLVPFGNIETPSINR